MFRAFAFAVVVAVCSACGEEPVAPSAPDTSAPVGFYEPWAGEWLGGVAGRTEGGASVAFTASASLVVDEGGLRLEHLCGEGVLVSYYVGEDRAYFQADRKNPCTIPTACGPAAFEIVSASLVPRDDEKVLVFIGLKGEECDKEPQSLILTGAMNRPGH